ncbi:MAG: hypothetical protein NT069_28735 [Planctomycetota bacterium]|nr:hypothetical protein [Planctomycetota bacterium]
MASLALAAAVLTCAVSLADDNPRTAYFTVGDTQDLLDTPVLDSRVTIAAAFESIQEKYGVERVWWRGGQDEVWGEEFVIRPENRGFARVWDWWRDLQYRKVGTNRIAVEEARSPTPLRTSCASTIRSGLPSIAGGHGGKGDRLNSLIPKPDRRWRTI